MESAETTGLESTTEPVSAAEVDTGVDVVQDGDFQGEY